MLFEKINTPKITIDDTNSFTGEDSKMNDNCNGYCYVQYQFNQIKQISLGSKDIINKLAFELQAVNKSQNKIINELKISQNELKNSHNELKSSHNVLKNELEELKISQNEIKISQNEIKNSHNVLKNELDELKISQNELKISQNVIMNKLNQLRLAFNKLNKEITSDRNNLALMTLLTKFKKDSNKAEKFDQNLINYFNSKPNNSRNTILQKHLKIGIGNCIAYSCKKHRIFNAIQASKSEILKEHLLSLYKVYYEDEEEDEDEEEE